jgi:ubiquitin carboxyl-terminal hydrolase 7
LEDTKKRLQTRTGLEDKEWNKVKINIVSEDELEVNLVSDDQEALFTASRPYQQGDRIGLDYIDKSTKMDRNGSGAIFIRG